MKKTLLAAAFAMAATSAVAGTEAQPSMDVTVITQNAAGAMSQEWLIPSIFAVLLVILVGGMGGGSITPT